MERKETAIEIKVGVLVLVSLTLLVIFIFTLGDFSFKDKSFIYIDFENTIGLKPGAVVQLSGIKVGRVEEVEFMGGQYDPELKRRVVVRVKLQIDLDKLDSIHEGALFFITTQGILGEKYIEIYVPPESWDNPSVSEGKAYPGQDPPRMELIVTKAVDLLNRLNIVFGEDRLGALLDNTNSLITHTDQMVLEGHPLLISLLEKFNQSAANLDLIMGDIKAITASIRHGVGDGSEIRTILKNLEHTIKKIRTKVKPVLEKLDKLLTGSYETVSLVKQLLEREEDNIHHLMEVLVKIFDKINLATDRILKVITHVASGKGNVGAFLMDDEIFDDIKEMVRELKRRPWKIIWKE